MTGPALGLGLLVAATTLAASWARASWAAAPARARAAALVTAPARSDQPTGSGVLQHLDRRLIGAAFTCTARTWLASWCGAVLVAGALGAGIGGVGLAATGVVAVGAVPAWLLQSRRGRADDTVEAALPAALEAVASGLRAGSTLPLAVAAAARGAGPHLGADLLDVADQARRVGFVAAVDAWPERRSRPAVRLAAAALSLSAEVGGAGARAIDGVALTIRQRREGVAEVRALATQARLSAVILATAPIAFAAFAGAADPRTLGFLFDDPAGQLCLVAGLGLDAIGAVWMGRTTRDGAR